MKHSYFWVVTQFSGMDVKTGYKTLTVATLIQGIVSMLFVLFKLTFHLRSLILRDITENHEEK